MNEGWIKLHRKMREWQHYQNPSARMVFEDLLLAANSKTRFWHGHEVKRGETMISISSLEFNTGLSRKTVIKVLKLLEKTGEIKRVKFAGAIKTIISNFDKYQVDSVTDGVESSGIIPPPPPPPGTPVDTPPPPPPGTPEQEYKEYKELKNNIPPSNEGVSGDKSPDPDKASQDRVDFVGIMNFFNRTMDEAGASIHRCKSCEGKRRDFVRARVKQHGIDAVYEMITKASLSDFLNGRTERPFLADFEWLFRPTNFQKVLEGKYDNKTIQQPQPNGTKDIRTGGYYHTGDEGRDQRAAAVATRIARLAAEDDARAAKVREP